MKNVPFTPGMLIVAVYVVLAVAVSSTILVVQRRFFLQPNEEQSFAVPGTVSFFAGLLFFWEVVSSDV